MTPDQFRDMCKRLEFNQVTAARFFDVSQTTISAWCAGKRAISGPAAVLAEGLSRNVLVRDAYVARIRAARGDGPMG